MKRMFLFAGLMLASSPSWAAFGSLPDYQTKLWRSSQSCAGFGSTFFSSGPVVIHQVNVASATLNNSALSYLAIMRSTASTVNNVVSTASFIGTNVLVAGVPPSWYVPLDIYSDSYTYINKQGIACTEVLWDWLSQQFIDFGSKW